LTTGSTILNAFVGRLHGTVEREYRQIVLPGSLETTSDTLPSFQHHYNTERPHQGLACGNRPPAVAWPQLPLWPPLPVQVDPDRWIASYQDRCFARRVRSDGTVFLDNRPYPVGSQYAGRAVVAQLDAATHQVRFFSEQRVLLATKPLRGLVGAPLSLEAFVTWCEQEAQALWRRHLRARPPRPPVTRAS
jgi:hypothetical protein